MKHLLKYSVVGSVIAGFAPFAFAVSDADGLVGTLTFTSLTANVSSVIGQAFPVAALAAGIMLAFAVLRWIISTVGHALGTRRA